MKLIATVGLPRSGKSTWAKTTGWPIVNPDSIRLALHGQRFYGPAEPMVWAIAHTMVEALRLAGHNVIVLDACNVTKKRRDEWERQYPGAVEFKVIETTAEECLRRANAEGDAEIVPVIERMAREWEPMQDGEGFKWTPLAAPPSTEERPGPIVHDAARYQAHYNEVGRKMAAAAGACPRPHHLLMAGEKCPTCAAPAPSPRQEPGAQPYTVCPVCGGSGKEGTGTPSGEGGEDFRECWKCCGTGAVHIFTGPPAPRQEQESKCATHGDKWIEGTDCPACGGKRVWHSGLGSTTTDEHQKCLGCGKERYVDGIDS